MGCAGEDAAPPSVDALEQALLRPEDLPSGWVDSTEPGFQDFEELRFCVPLPEAPVAVAFRELSELAPAGEGVIGQVLQAYKHDADEVFAAVRSAYQSCDETRTGAEPIPFPNVADDIYAVGFADLETETEQRAVLVRRNGVINLLIVLGVNERELEQYARLADEKLEHVLEQRK
jgi:hypothetical protein